MVCMCVCVVGGGGGGGGGGRRWIEANSRGKLSLVVDAVFRGFVSEK